MLPSQLITFKVKHHVTMVSFYQLSAIQAKLDDLQASNLRYCSHILQATIAGFQKRFKNFLQLETDVNEAILATVTHPYFKMRWLPPRLTSEKKRIHQLILHSAEELGLLSESDVASSSTTNENDDEFFVFSDQGKENIFPLYKTK